MTERSSAGRTVSVLSAVVFVDLLGLTVMLPVLPSRVVELGGGGLALGLVLAGFSAGQAVAAPLLGRCADRFGRRRVLLLGLAGSTLSLAAMAGAGSVWLLLAARVLAGLCGGSIGVAHALAADVSPPDQRSRAMGRLGMSLGAAFTIGPLLGAAGAGGGFALVCAVGAGLAGLALLTAWRALPRTDGAPRPAAAAPDLAGGPGRRIAALLGVALAGSAALVGMEATVALLAGHRFGAGPGFVGILLSVAGVAMTLVQARPLVGAVRRWGERPVAAGAAGLMAAGLLLLPAAPMVGFVLAVAAVAAGYGLLSTTTTSLLSLLAPAGRRGAVLGRGQAMSATGRLVGPVLAGALYDLRPTLPSVAGAALLALAALALTTTGPVRGGATMAAGTGAEGDG